QDEQNHVSRERLEELMKSSVERLGVNRARELGVFEGLLLVGTRSPTEIEDLPFVRALREVSNRGKGRPLVDPEAGAEQPLGLFDALQGESLDKCVRSTGIPGLSILPLRRTHATSVGKLSPSELSRVIEEAADRFDTVLVDTGPILGSLEASIVSTKVHGVVVAVSRGEQQNLVERALRHLASLGSNVHGMIFNRARIVDVVRSSRPVSSRHEGSLL
ncbi:MAG: P-loop NTPase family protein, partial [Planctomycetota bacterium]